MCGECSDHTLEIDGDGQQHRVCSQCFLLLGEQGLVGQGQYRHKLEQESVYSVDISSSLPLIIHLDSLKYN